MSGFSLQEKTDFFPLTILMEVVFKHYVFPQTLAPTPTFPDSASHRHWWLFLSKLFRKNKM